MNHILSNTHHTNKKMNITNNGHIHVCDRELSEIAVQFKKITSHHKIKKDYKISISITKISYVFEYDNVFEIRTRAFTHKYDSYKCMCYDQLCIDKLYAYLHVKKPKVEALADEYIAGFANRNKKTVDASGSVFTITGVITSENVVYLVKNHCVWYSPRVISYLYVTKNYVNEFTIDNAVTHAYIEYESDSQTPCECPHEWYCVDELQNRLKN